MANYEITNIRPSFDQDEGVDILEFMIDGSEYSEVLEGRSLGREVDSCDGMETVSNLADDFDETAVEDIHGQLEVWIAANKDSRFSKETIAPGVENIEHGLNVSEGFVVWLDEATAERLNVEYGVYEITRDGSTSWTDRDFGDQYSENNPGGDATEIARRYMLANPESGISDIEASIEYGVIAQLREEAAAVEAAEAA